MIFFVQWRTFDQNKPVISKLFTICTDILKNYKRFPALQYFKLNPWYHLPMILCSIWLSMVLELSKFSYSTIKICHLQHYNHQRYVTSDQEPIIQLFYDHISTIWSQILRQKVCTDDRLYCSSDQSHNMNYFIFNNKCYRTCLNVTIDLLLNSCKA